MNQTPAHDAHNPDLLKLIPKTAKKVIEIGCSSGALAREFKKSHKDVNWIGIDIDSYYGELAKANCDRVITMNFEDCSDDLYLEFSDRDCWIFGDSLEHLKDPWLVLSRIRRVIPSDGFVVACVPNAQHWSVIVRLAVGDFRYEDSGLMDRTHLRWFTRQTIFELFEGQGFRVIEGAPRIFNELHRDKFLSPIAEIAKGCGISPELVINDVMALQYLVCAVPA